MLDKAWCVKYRGNLSVELKKAVHIVFTADLQPADVFCRAVMHRKCATNRCVTDRELTEIEVRYWCSFLLRGIQLFSTLKNYSNTCQWFSNQNLCLFTVHHRPWFLKKKKNSIHSAQKYLRNILVQILTVIYNPTVSCASAAHMVK